MLTDQNNNKTANISYISKTAKMMNGDTLFQQQVDIVACRFCHF